MNNRNHGSEPGDQSYDAMGGPDESAHEDELGPEQAGDEDTFGGADRSAHEDELGAEQAGDEDTFGGPDRSAHEDELKPGHQQDSLPGREPPMTTPAGARRARLAGKALLTLANVITIAAPVAADWNASHIFNPRWPAHARFHGVTALAMATALSSASVWLIWSGNNDQDAARFFAAAVPVAYWAPFFVAPLVPGTAVDDPPHPVPRLAGVPTNLLGAAVTTATAAAGWLLDRRADR